MSMSQALLGASIITAVGYAAINLVLSPLLPAPITVHSLTYQSGIVSQDRTIVTDGTSFYAQWAAAVIDTATGEAVPWCTGSGSFPYQPGHKVKEFPLAEWVGNANCTADSLNPGTYFLRASWQWGATQTSRDSAAFEVVE